MYYIYEIKNLINGKTYIGQRRCSKGKTPKTDKYMGSGELIRKAIKKYGLENFTKIILEEGIETKEEVNEREIYWISKYREEGKAEYNLSNGGEGVHCTGKIEIERRNKISLSLQNHPCSEETREKIGAKSKNRYYSEETRQKMSENNAWKGKHLSDEHKRKISESHKGKMYSEELRRKISESHKGKKLSEDVRRKISESSKGRIVSKETREKLRKANLGRKMTLEDRKKMSEKAKLRIGEKASRFGKHHSEETKQKIRDGLKKYRNEHMV